MIFYRRWQRPGIISFDLDDTLYDNKPVLLQAEQQLKLHLEQIEPQLANWQLMDWWQVRRKLAKQQPELAQDASTLRLASIEQVLLSLGHSKPQATQLAEQAMALFLHHRNQIQLAPAVVQLMQALAARYPLVAITNGNADPEQFGLKGIFSSYHTPGNGLRMKPYPDLFQQAQQQHQRHSTDWLHIGDHTRTDVGGALAMGWQACWLNNRPHRKPLLQLPHVEIRELGELEALLLA